MLEAREISVFFVGRGGGGAWGRGGGGARLHTSIHTHARHFKRSHGVHPKCVRVCTCVRYLSLCTYILSLFNLQTNFFTVSKNFTLSYIFCEPFKKFSYIL